MPSPHSDLFALTDGQRGRYAGAVCALAVGTGFTLAAPLLARTAIDRLVPFSVPPSVLPLGGDLPLAVVALLVVVLSVAGAASFYLTGRWSAVATEAVVRRLRERLFDHLQWLPCSYHDGADSGDLVQRCTSDVETVRLFLSTQVVQLGRAALMLVVVLPVMLRMDQRLTLVSLIGMPLILLSGWLFFRRVQQVFAAADEAEGELTTVIQENLRGNRVVRAFSRQDYERARFGAANGLFRDRNFKLIQLMSTFWAFSEMLCLGQLGAALFVGAHWVATGTLSLGTLFAFLAYAKLLMTPMRQLGRTLSDLGKAQVSVRRIGEILAEAADAPLSTVSAGIGIGAGAIEVHNLRFGYGNGVAIDDLSFSVAAGETLAILGPSGAGKTTLVQILLRLYDYHEGSVRIDGLELSQLDRGEVRRSIAAVLQEPFLFSDTVSANVRFGGASPSHAEVVRATEVACIHDEVMGFEREYATLVGERGVSLSGGQRQRLALARALIGDPPILILDDSLSAVDSATEVRIRDALVRRRGRRTTLVIAHRLTTLASADRTLVLERGRAVQIGSHEELIRNEGPYRRLWRLQEEIDAESAGQLASSGGRRT